MSAVFIQGFAVSIGLIFAIGAQNAFVLRQGLRGEHVLAVVLACAVSDTILMSAGVLGFAALNDVLPGLAPIMRWVGAAFLVVYGAMSLRAAIRGGQSLEAGERKVPSMRRAVLVCLALTWLNPHVYLDTVLLIGSIGAGHGDARLWFLGGAITASFVFFFTLGYGARLLRPLFARPVTWRILDVLICAMMWAIAVALVLGT